MNPRRLSWSPGFSRFLRFFGALLLAGAVTAIWSLRLTSRADVYLSEMGAPDAPAAPLFNTALLLLAIGGILVAVARRRTRSSVGVLGAWTVSATLVFACLSIAVASRVTCTPGCPVPFTAGSTAADVVHTLFATLGFGGVGLAIIQAAFAPGLRALHPVSIASGALIILLSGTGGLLSIFHYRVDLGGWLELAAATIALLWVIAFALVPAGVSGSSAPTPAVAPPATS
ncbi:DUF998 domain-containing protein [Subtercola boreus]|uniref:DUF998 domain-containing protein n=1 Tax=Subtercola boreus TaxID=120213 RepID=A0A3E0WBX8_9MICO|nr:DUF998 domain-containing protein [Subtercola boreus]RFA19832.1 hypothetical protein B7R24_10935 [Subtercola boreus]RFA19899.1 hypothetical protein B7R23_10915 [Subtercola boreus]RFA26292.1 hypothetical protein B7R25_11035 [Subtercola boreus]